jgi:hypothetical protein
MTEPANVRKLAYALLIAVAAGSAAGRIVGMERVYEPRLGWPAERPAPVPTHGDNDRSRWDTVRALVDDGTYVIGHRDRSPGRIVPSALAPLAGPDALQAAMLATAGQRVRLNGDRGIISEDGWKTIDKVMRPDTGDFYSSKPPFLATVVAGLYWLLKHLLGWSIVADSWAVVRTILVVVNGLPFVLYLWLLARLVERYGVTNWGRLYVVAAACFATLVTPFLTTLNNHTVGTFAALFALYPVARIWDMRDEGGTPPAYLFLLAGFLAGMTACLELPAAAFAAALFGVLVIRSPGRTLALFVPACLLPVAFFVGTNYLAIHQWMPAYTQVRGPWYQIEGSYWSNEAQKTIDFARHYESRGMYAFHVLIGHHGWFSLTPIWLFALGGMAAGLAASWRRRPLSAGLPFLYPLTVVVSLVVIGFYISIEDRNYGGWTSGLRWLIWLTPLWLLCMLPAVDWLAGRLWGRWLGYLLLAVSALSASFPAWSPWRHPWLYRLMDWWGWIPY